MRRAIAARHHSSSVKERLATAARSALLSRIGPAPAARFVGQRWPRWAQPLRPPCTFIDRQRRDSDGCKRPSLHPSPQVRATERMTRCAGFVPVKSLSWNFSGTCDRGVSSPGTFGGMMPAIGRRRARPFCRRAGADQGPRSPAASPPPPRGSASRAVSAFSPAHHARLSARIE